MINLSEFVRANKKVAIWVTFFALLFLVREVFGLVFLTFILAYIFNNLVVKLERHFRLKRYYWTVVVYLLFVSVVTSLMIMAMPRIITEAKDFFNQLPESMNAIRLVSGRTGSKTASNDAVSGKRQRRRFPEKFVGLEQ
jgi:predicted PurR-regulated permease PerM